jgi:RIO kinase 2
MKLDPTVMRTMDRTDFRVLEAIEMGQLHKQHEIVTLVQIHQLSNLRHGGSHKIVSSLLRDKLISHETHGGIDGYRLTNAGYDILALYTLKRHHIISAFGQKIGTGKESDIYLASSPTGCQVVLKFHRLGRTSFRNVRQKRDYFNNQKQNERTNNWLFLSKLSAMKEYAFMKALYDVQYNVPKPIYYNRHVICMNLIRGIPLYQIHSQQLSVEVACDIYEQSITLISKLAIQHGLIHCDFNEYNLLVDLSGIQALVTDDTADPYVRHSGGQSIAPDQSMGALSKPPWEQTLIEQHQETTDVNVIDPLPEPVARLSNGEPKPIVTLIDFPQMISIQHINGQDYYERDVQCIQNFFINKLTCQIPLETCPVTQYAQWENVLQLCMNHTSSSSSGDGSSNPKNPTTNRMDTTLRASGFSQARQDSSDRMLELYYFTEGPRPIASAVIPEDDDKDEEEDGQHDAVGEIDNHDDSDDFVSCADSTALPKIIMDGLEHLNITSTPTTTTTTTQQQRDAMIERTKARVQKQVQEQMKRPKQTPRTATNTKKRNMNKSYIKGKRVHADVF